MRGQSQVKYAVDKYELYLLQERQSHIIDKKREERAFDGESVSVETKAFKEHLP